MKQVAVAIRINTPLVELVAHQVQVVALVANTTPLQVAHQLQKPHQPHQLKKMKQVAVAIRTNTPLVELVAHQVQVVALVANTTPLQVAHQLQKPHQPQRHQLVVGTL